MIPTMGEAGGQRHRWVVIGTNAAGQLVSLTIESVSAERAEAAATKQGIIVSSVAPELEPAESGAQPPEYEPPESHLYSVSAGAAFKFGFYAFFGFVCGGLVLALLLVLLNLIFAGAIWSTLR
jgi:hypothetical protein